MEHHFVCHMADKMAVAREEEKEITRDLNKMAYDFIDLCFKNATDAREWAKTNGTDDLSRNLMFSSNAAQPGMNLTGKLVQPESEKSKSGLDEMRESMRKQRDALASTPSRQQSG